MPSASQGMHCQEARLGAEWLVLNQTLQYEIQVTQAVILTAVPTCLALEEYFDF